MIGEECSCEETEFGCCPDNLTPSTGPENEGCGCHFGPNGCCPDGMTSALGTNFTGCPCETFTHGCCMDGITVAQGPNLEGCSCNSSFGCCPDGVTPKVRFLNFFIETFTKNLTQAKKYIHCKKFTILVL